MKVIQLFLLRFINIVVAFKPTEVTPFSTTTSTTVKTCSATTSNWPLVIPASNSKKARNIGVVLFRSFTMLDVYGPLNALQSLARIYPLNLYLLSQDLKPVSTEPFTPELNPPNSSFWFTLPPTHTFADPPMLDVLLVPGGWGWEESDLKEHVEFIAKIYPSLEYLITVCVGSILAARAGVLDGRNATANKRFWETTKRFPAVHWVPTARWVVDGNIWTTSGVSAGIDGVLGWINHVYGTGNATNIAQGMEYEAHKDPSWDPFSHYFNTTSYH